MNVTYTDDEAQNLIELLDVAPVPGGAWLEGTAEVVRATKTLVFVQGSAAVEGATALRFNAVFKIGPKRDYANPLDPYDLLPASKRK